MKSINLFTHLICTRRHPFGESRIVQLVLLVILCTGNFAWIVYRPYSNFCMYMYLQFSEQVLYTLC